MELTLLSPKRSDVPDTHTHTFHTHNLAYMVLLLFQYQSTAHTNIRVTWCLFKFVHTNNELCFCERCPQESRTEPQHQQSDITIRFVRCVKSEIYIHKY